MVLHTSEEYVCIPLHIFKTAESPFINFDTVALPGGDTMSKSSEPGSFRCSARGERTTSLGAWELLEDLELRYIERPWQWQAQTSFWPRMANIIVIILQGLNSEFIWVGLISGVVHVYRLVSMVGTSEGRQGNKPHLHRINFKTWVKWVKCVYTFVWYTPPQWPTHFLSGPASWISGCRFTLGFR